MTIAGLAVGATKGYVYIRSSIRTPSRTMQRGDRAAPTRSRLSRRRRRGSAASAFDLEVRLGAGAYICGEETSLLESLEGKRGMVRAKPPLPAIAGPVRQADRRQQRALARHRADHPGRGRRVLPRLRHGPLARHAAAPARRQHQARRPGREGLRPDAARADRRLRRRHRQRAGRSARCRSAGRWAPTCPAAHARHAARLRGVRGAEGACSAMAASSCSTTRVDMAQQARFAMEFCAIESCGKCTPCRIGSTRGVEVIDKIVAGAERDRSKCIAAATTCARPCSTARCARWAA